MTGDVPPNRIRHKSRGIANCSARLFPGVPAPQIALAAFGTGFHIIPIARPFLAPCKGPGACFADFFGQVGFGVFLLGHRLSKNAAALALMRARSSSANLS